MNRAGPNPCPRSSQPDAPAELATRRRLWFLDPRIVPQSCATAAAQIEIEHRWVAVPEIYAEREAPYSEVA